MAKEDFCFTYYDGDAARDKAHMSRLQRGAYDDLISAQRKFGHLSDKQIRMVLSKDYDECWPALELVLQTDEEGLFFIEWVEKSIQKMKAASEINRKKIKSHWEKKKLQNNCGNTTVILQNTISKGSEEPTIEDGNGYVLEGVQGEEWNTMPGHESIGLSLPDLKRQGIVELLAISKNIQATNEQINGLWRVFKIQHFTGKKYYADVGEAHRHFMNWINKQPIAEIQKNIKTQSSNHREEEGRNQMRELYGEGK